MELAEKDQKIEALGIELSSSQAQLTAATNQTQLNRLLQRNLLGQVTELKTNAQGRTEDFDM